MDNSILIQLKGKLIVSCQALIHEPLHGSEIMARMALAATLGGASGIRANSPEDIIAIKKIIRLPVIGIHKVNYPDSPVMITPTMREIDDLAAAKPEIIALDATDRLRPGGVTLDELYAGIRQRYPDQLLMADCSTLAEGIHAAELGFDCVATTLCGYTEYTQGAVLPCLSLVHDLAARLSIPVIAEGGIWSPDELRAAMEQGAYAGVVGTAITRPLEITRRFADVLE
ncbi:MAG: N-acetylmannosamine-6-phosphate 2-epimerase [Clostridiaceae bacterium]|nr:N-acetylmannosamine-6-phosphate 2-epimerase [Clostridiaceae bacterium]